MYCFSPVKYVPDLMSRLLPCTSRTIIVVVVHLPRDEFPIGSHEGSFTLEALAGFLGIADWRRRLSVLHLDIGDDDEMTAVVVHRNFRKEKPEATVRL